jgi:hypothetical protein
MTQHGGTWCKDRHNQHRKHGDRQHVSRKLLPRTGDKTYSGPTQKARPTQSLELGQHRNMHLSIYTDTEL